MWPRFPFSVDAEKEILLNIILFPHCNSTKLFIFFYFAQKRFGNFPQWFPPKWMTVLFIFFLQQWPQHSLSKAMFPPFVTIAVIWWMVFEPGVTFEGQKQGRKDALPHTTWFLLSSIRTSTPEIAVWAACKLRPQTQSSNSHDPVIFKEWLTVKNWSTKQTPRILQEFL